VASKVSSNSGKSQKLWVNFVISGEPAEVFRQLKERGIVHSTRDAFTQGIMCLQEKIVRSDLKKAQLEATKSLKERGYCD
jgi:hypothetical protein